VRPGKFRESSVRSAEIVSAFTLCPDYAERPGEVLGHGIDGYTLERGKLVGRGADRVTKTAAANCVVDSDPDGVDDGLESKSEVPAFVGGMKSVYGVLVARIK
jgi:hypothetical protein